MNIDAIIVTYNRLSKLKKAIDALLKQTIPFRNIIIVNNCSTDGTADYLEKLSKEKLESKIILINSLDNSGGSGGFYLGQLHTLKLNPDWLYLQDDDAYPEPNMNEKFINFIKAHTDNFISAVCGKVTDIDGKIDYTHRSNFKFKYGILNRRYYSSSEDYTKPKFKINLFSYVGSFINFNIMKKTGLVNKDFFIYFDDSDHSYRLSKSGKIFCVPDINIVHDSGQNQSDPDSIGWRDYYAIRNFGYFLCRNNKISAIWYTLSIFFKRYYQYGPESRKLILTAIKDAWNSKLGKHHIYLPPYQIKKNS